MPLIMAGGVLGLPPGFYRLLDPAFECVALRSGDCFVVSVHDLVFLCSGLVGGFQVLLFLSVML